MLPNGTKYTRSEISTGGRGANSTVSAEGEAGSSENPISGDTVGLHLPGAKSDEPLLAIEGKVAVVDVEPWYRRAEGDWGIESGMTMASASVGTSSQALPSRASPSSVSSSVDGAPAQRRPPSVDGPEPSSSPLRPFSLDNRRPTPSEMLLRLNRSLKPDSFSRFSPVIPAIHGGT